MYGQMHVCNIVTMFPYFYVNYYLFQFVVGWEGRLHIDFPLSGCPSLLVGCELGHDAPNPTHKR